MNYLNHQRNFIILLVILFVLAGFLGLEISKTMTDLTLIEASLYNVTRNGETRSLSEISRDILDINAEDVEANLEKINNDIDSL